MDWPERVLRWLYRKYRCRTTDSCGPHCAARPCGQYLIPDEWYLIPDEYHCPCGQCHGKEE